jgi:hypothetical protein
MTSFIKTLTASLTPQGNVGMFRWYSGAFKEVSKGKVRAVSRAISNFITQKQEL